MAKSIFDVIGETVGDAGVGLYEFGDESLNQLANEILLQWEGANEDVRDQMQGPYAQSDSRSLGPDIPGVPTVRQVDRASEAIFGRPLFDTREKPLMSGAAPLMTDISSEASEGERARAETAAHKSATELMSKQARYEAAKQNQLERLLEPLRAASSPGTDVFAAKGDKTSLLKNKSSKGSFTKSLPSIGEEVAKKDITSADISEGDANFLVENLGAGDARNYASQLMQLLKKAQLEGRNKKELSYEEQAKLNLGERRDLLALIKNPDLLALVKKELGLE